MMSLIITQYNKNNNVVVFRKMFLQNAVQQSSYMRRYVLRPRRNLGYAGPSNDERQ